MKMRPPVLLPAAGLDSGLSSQVSALHSFAAQVSGFKFQPSSFVPQVSNPGFLARVGSGRCALALAGMVLATATVLIAIDLPPAPHFTPSASIASMLPGAVDGWEARDLPLGETESSSAAAIQTLQMDDYAYRVYRRGGAEVAVYVAYWRPGNPVADEVYRHTPDQCWPAAGLVCRERMSNVDRPFPAVQLEPGEYRRFGSPAGDIYVWFWRIEGGRVSPLLPAEVTIGWRELAQRGWVKLSTALSLGRKESVLVRISSNLDPAAAGREHLFTTIAESLAATGLVVAATTET